MADLRQFSIRIRDVAKGVPVRTDRMVRQVILVCTATVVLRTPVDTGRARSNWQATVGPPAVGTLPEPASPGEGAQRAVQAANTAASTYNGGGEANITNNLPYIGELNRGHSQQAPANFVQEAVAVGIKKIQSSRILR